MNEKYNNTYRCEPSVFKESIEAYKKQYRSKFYIAISGKSGCGNTTVSTLLAQFLGIAMVNYTLRNMAKERAVSLWDLQEQAKIDSQIDKDLDQKQKELASLQDCVLASRLAVWLLDKPILKLILEAPLEVRAKRVAQREQKCFEQAFIQTQKRDYENAIRYRKIYGLDVEVYPKDACILDVSVISAEEAVLVILAILQKIF